MVVEVDLCSAQCVFSCADGAGISGRMVSHTGHTWTVSRLYVPSGGFSNCCVDWTIYHTCHIYMASHLWKKQSNNLLILLIVISCRNETV